MWLKNKNRRTKNKNIRCARQMWKQIFITLTFVNMNTKKTWWGYGVRSLVLNILKEMRGLSFIYTPLSTELKQDSKEAFIYALNKKTFW